MDSGIPVRDVYTASLSSGELPHQIAVDIPEEEVSGFGELSGARDVVQNPPNLQTAEVSGQGQASQLAEAIRAAFVGELSHSVLDARVLPDDGVVNGDARLAVPDDGGLALISNPDGGDILRANSALLHSFRHDLVNAPPDFLWVVLHPAGFGINLLVLFLRDGDDPSRRVEDDESRACGSLIDGTQISRHFRPFLSAKLLNCDPQDWLQDANLRVA